MKAFTDIEQSKKLAEILPLESADMRYAPFGDTHPWVRDCDLIEKDSIPCWSLAALLDVLPKCIGDSFYLDIAPYETQWSCLYENLDELMDSKDFDKGILLCKREENLIDACYEMIILLHEQELL